ncbi:unnamed protein product [Heterobilharzia americana]|nr:unnamed protein product [Heterobilharzia americana]
MYITVMDILKLSNVIIFIGYLLCITLSTEESVDEIDQHIYLKVPHGVAVQYQYPMRAGYSPGTLGSEHSAIIIPPESSRKSQLTFLYHESIDEYKKLRNYDENRIKDFHYKYYDSLIKIHKLKLKADEKNKKFYNYLILELSNARLQYMMYYCTARLEFTKRLDNTNVSYNIIQIANSADNNISNNHSTKRKDPLISQYDIHQFCPKACAHREGLGFNEKHRAELDRYSSLCNSPSNLMTTLSQRCIEQDYLGLVHLQSFKCECPKDFIWKEQLKACYLPYGWRQRAEKVNNLISIKRNDLFKYTIENKCSRIGTKFILPIEVNIKNSSQSNRNILYHTERCICKDEYFGTYCDQQKDPCKMPVGNVIMGDIACRVADGNKCIPSKEFGTYTCQCIRGYKKLVNTTLLPRERASDNCLIRVDPCILEPCKHGICVMSDHGSVEEEKAKLKGISFTWFENKPRLIARCICDDGWRGERCSLPVSKNIWSLWSPWSFCVPSCQSSFTQVPPNHFPEKWEYGVGTRRWGMRQRSRYRDCLSKASDCDEEIHRTAGYRRFVNRNEVIWRQYEHRGCRPRPCDRHLYLASGLQATQKSRLSSKAEEIFYQSHTVLIWTMLTFTFVFAIFAFIATLVIKMFSERIYRVNA